MPLRTPTKPVETLKPLRRVNVPKTDSKPPQTILVIGDRVQIGPTVKPKKYAGKRGEILALAENEYQVLNGWFRASELCKI